VPPIASERPRAVLAVLFSVVVIDLIGFGIVLPILPFYADAYGADGTLLGLLFMVYAAAQFVCAPLWGRLSDRIGRRPVMLGTIAGTAGSLLLLGLADSLAGLFVARALGGVFAANVSVASAYITDVTEEVERTRWMGVLGACFGVGFVLGPALGGALAPLGYAVPMLVAAGLGAANLVHAAVSLREPPRHAEVGGAAPRRRLALLRDPLVRRLCVLNLAFSAAVTQLEVIFAFFMKDTFGWDAPRVAVILVGMAVLMGGVQGGGMKALSARFPERALAIGGSLVLAASLAAVPAAPGIAWLVVALAVAAVGRAVVQPSLLSLVSATAVARERGVAMGVFQSAGSLARVAGPVAAGVLYDLDHAAPFALAAVLLVVGAGLARGLPAEGVGRGPAAEPAGGP
jgi:MFS family permease